MLLELQFCKLFCIMFFIPYWWKNSCMKPHVFDLHLSRHLHQHLQHRCSHSTFKCNKGYTGGAQTLTVKIWITSMDQWINTILDLVIMLKNMEIFASTIKSILRKYCHLFWHPYNWPLSYMSMQWTWQWNSLWYIIHNPSSTIYIRSMSNPKKN